MDAAVARRIVIKVLKNMIRMRIKKDKGLCRGLGFKVANVVGFLLRERNSTLGTPFPSNGVRLL